MGKKGKKGKKATGTPDVVKFKETAVFKAIEHIIPGPGPVFGVSKDFCPVRVMGNNMADKKKLSDFLNMLAILTDSQKAGVEKHYRFQLHHHFLLPHPQYFPTGYRSEVIEISRTIPDQPGLKRNGKVYKWSEELRKLADDFLGAVDKFLINDIPGFLEENHKCDFTKPGGLKTFKTHLCHKMTGFDKMWAAYEQVFLKELHGLYCQVFEPVETLYRIELQLVDAEKNLDIEEKQRLENELVPAIVAFCDQLFPDQKVDDFPTNVIPLAEACIFYETKCTAENINLCRHVITMYMDLRMYVAQIPWTRLETDFAKNETLNRMVKNFHQSVLDARDALDFVSRLPPLVGCKRTNWITRALLEEEVNGVLHAAGEASNASRSKCSFWARRWDLDAPPPKPEAA